MTRTRTHFVILQLTLAVALTGVTEAQSATRNVQLTLPIQAYVVVGVEFSVYFDNIVLVESTKDLQFEVDCPVGQTEARRWTLTPRTEDVGAHRWSVSVRDADGRQLAQNAMRIQVVPASAGADQRIKLLVVGDSLTHASAYPNQLARRLSEPANPDWQMLGTHRPQAAAAGVRHEGYGGWTWQRFVSRYEPNPDGTHRKRSSPFVFLDDSGQPQLDVARYFQKSTAGNRPDVVFFLLGINDCFSADPEDAAAIDARIDTVLAQADTLLAEFRRAAPQADLCVCITTPPNARESGFQANYKGRYHRWGWKRIQHRLVQRMLRRYQPNRKASPQLANVFVVPTHLNLDPVNGYPVNNGVHPNDFGYRQIGDSLYAWLKWRMVYRNTQPLAR